MKKFRNAQRFWLVVALVALPLTGFVLWSRLAPSAGPGAEASGGGGAAALSGGSASATAAAADQAQATPAPRSDVAATVAQLPISAVLPGDPPRIMVSGRVVRVGEIVEGDLTFAGLQEHELRFSDSRGVIYTRRY